MLLGAGQARRPGDELSQRSRSDPGLRGRRPHRCRRRARRASTRFELTDNFHFFTELAQRIIKVGQLPGPAGPALPGRHAAAADRQIGQPGDSAERVPPLLRGRRRPALGTAGADAGPRRLRRRGLRPGGDGGGRSAASTAWPGSRSWPTRSVDMRERLEASGSERDLKRGFGGIVDIEFLVQMFRLKYGRTCRRAGTQHLGGARRPARRGSSPPRSTRRCAPATISCAWSRAGCASSTTARWTSCPNSRRIWKSWPAASAAKAPGQERRPGLPARAGAAHHADADLFLELFRRRVGADPCAEIPRKNKSPRLLVGSRGQQVARHLTAAGR